MVVRNADGTVQVERGRANGFYANAADLVGERKFRAHRGRNRFLCDGRLMLTHHPAPFIVTLFLIISTMTSFYVFDAAYVAEHISLAMPLVASVLFIMVMANLLKTTLSDPGIMPRASNKEVIEQERLYRLETGNQNAALPRTKTVEIFNECVHLKYCFTCRLFRPPRSSHCSVCDNCVLRFDHHCPWVGNCVGLRNYRYFYLFVVLLTALDLFVGGSAIAHLVMLSVEERTFVNAIRVSPGSLFVAIICFFSVWSVLGLSGFHTYLLASNQTTNEEVKDTFADMWPSHCGSLYSSGNFLANCWGTLCAPEVPSLLDRRGRIEAEPVVEVQPTAAWLAPAAPLANGRAHPRASVVIPQNSTDEPLDPQRLTSAANGSVRRKRHSHSSSTSSASSIRSNAPSYSSGTVVSARDEPAIIPAHFSMDDYSDDEEEEVEPKPAVADSPDAETIREEQEAHRRTVRREDDAAAVTVVAFERHAVTNISIQSEPNGLQRVDR